MTSDKRQQQRHKIQKNAQETKKKTQDAKKTQVTKKDTRDNKDTREITNRISSLGKPSKNEIQQTINNKKVFQCVLKNLKL